MVKGESVYISMEIPTNQRSSFLLVVTHILTATINYFPKALNPQHNPIIVLLPFPLLYNLMNPLSIQAPLLRFSTQTDHNNGFQSTGRKIVHPLTCDFSFSSILLLVTTRYLPPQTYRPSKKTYDYRRFATDLILIWILFDNPQVIAKSFEVTELPNFFCLNLRHESGFKNKTHQSNTHKQKKTEQVDICCYRIGDLPIPTTYRKRTIPKNLR
ncbi:hypothetical protein YC2023_020794 [Brassica napus]